MQITELVYIIDNLEKMQIQFPVFYTFPQEEITTSNLFYLPQSYENFYFFQIPVEQQS